MTWRPGQSLLRKVGGKYVQLPRMSEYAAPSTVYLTGHDDDKIDAWIREQRLSVPKKQWNKQTAKSKKKGGETT